ncbi:MAG: hypothetical protein ABR511_04490, partial [Acidimicrobiales bacterium]
MARALRTKEDERGHDRPGATPAADRATAGFALPASPLSRPAVTRLQARVGNAATGRMVAARAAGRPASARPPGGTVQRTPYLANADDLIYGDSLEADKELAFVGSFAQEHTFVNYSAVHDLRDWAIGEAIRAKGGIGGGKGKKEAGGGPKSRIGKPERRRPPTPRRGGGGAVGGDSHYQINAQVTGAI